MLSFSCKNKCFGRNGRGYGYIGVRASIVMFREEWEGGLRLSYKSNKKVY